MSLNSDREHREPSSGSKTIEILKKQQNNSIEKKPFKRQLSSNSSRNQQQKSKKTISESLQKINQQFNEQHTTAISIWSEWTCSSCEKLVKNLLQSEDEHFIFSATNWDVISIQEEGEGGEKVQSTIRVPSIVRHKLHLFREK